MKITNYELTSDKIIAELYDGTTETEYKIDRQKFEDWLTGGTGMVDMGFTHHNGNVLTEVEVKEPIADYWLQGEEINNSPVLEHLLQYIKSVLSEQEIIALFVQERILSFIPDADKLLAKSYLREFAYHNVIHGISEMQKNLNAIQHKANAA